MLFSKRSSFPKELINADDSDFPTEEESEKEQLKNNNERHI